MENMKLNMPSDIRGEWIWPSQPSGKLEAWAFFRREFTLNPGFGKAELWISANSEYHINTNGRHIGYGPAPASRDSAYIESYDTLCLEPGVNVFAIAARGVMSQRLSQSVREPGFWCQLNIDDRPFLWTDDSWETLEGCYFASNQPSRGSCLAHCEKVRMGEYPDGWDDPGFDSSLWSSPDILRDLRHGDIKIASSPIPHAVFEPRRATLCVKGDFHQPDGCAFVSFSDLGDSRATCAAEAHVHLHEGMHWDFLLNVSEDPVKIFINDVLCHERGGGSGALCGCGLAETRITVSTELSPGWNRILVIQNAHPDGMGFFLGSTAPNYGLLFQQTPDFDSEPGWKVAGPLKTPFKLAGASLRLETLVTRKFIPAMDNLNDPSTLLSMSTFDIAGDQPPETAGEGVTLAEGQFAVFELDGLRFGFPKLELEADSSAIIDVTFSDNLSTPDSDLRRGLLSTDTLQLNAGVHQWTRFSPLAAKSFCVSVRKHSGQTLRIRDASFDRMIMPFTDTSSFESSDFGLNELWEVCVDLLRSSAVQTFMANPFAGQWQTLGSSFLLSMATFHAFGDYKLARKALREFSDAQYETGMIPATPTAECDCPSLRSPLILPVWLRYHHMLTGDKATLEDSLSSIERLMDFYLNAGLTTNGLLKESDDRHCPYDDFLAEPTSAPFSTSLNSLFCRSIVASAYIFETLDIHDKAEHMRDLAAGIASRIRGGAQNQSTGVFHDSFGDSNESASNSLANLMALSSGVAAPEDFKTIFAAFHDLKSDSEDPDIPSDPYHEFFLAETACMFGEKRWALNRIRRRIGAVMRNSSSDSADAANAAPPPPTSDVVLHASIPITFIMRELVGIRPATPGFSQFYFNPEIDMVDNVKAMLPTPYGKIKVSWRRQDSGSLFVGIDSTYAVDVLPMLPEPYTSNCEFEVNNNVNILYE